MARIHSKDTSPELIVRSLLHTNGYRFRLHRRDLPGSPDIVFPSRRRVIFVHGCFWHAHRCHLGRPPKSHLEFWLPKLERNRQKDERNRRQLRALGWSVLTVWQCQIKNGARLKPRLFSYLGSATKNPIDKLARSR